MAFSKVGCLILFCVATEAHCSASAWEEAPFMGTPPFSPEKHHVEGFTIRGTAYIVTGNERMPEFDHCGECATFKSFSDAYFSYSPETGWKNLGPHPGGPRGYAISNIMDPGTDHEIVYFGFGMTYYPDPSVSGGYLLTPRWGFDDAGNYTRFNSSALARLGDFWSFDGSDWRRLADFPGIGRTHPGMVAVNGKVYVGLGYGELCPTTDPCEPHSGYTDVRGKSGDLNDVWEYDVATDTWTELPEPFPYRAHHPFAFSSGGRPFFMGGHAGGYTYHETYTLDDDRKWRKVADIPSGKGRVAGTQFSHGGLGYILCGESAPGEGNVMAGWANVVDVDGYDASAVKVHHRALDTCEFWAYNSATDMWVALPAAPGKSRWAPTSFVLDGYVYLLNGAVRVGQANFSLEWPQVGYRYKLQGSSSLVSGTAPFQQVSFSAAVVLGPLICSVTILFG